MRPSKLLAAVLAVSSVSAAMSDVFGDIYALDDVKNILLGRQTSDNSSDNNDSKTDDNSQSATATAKVTSSADSDEAKSTASASATRSNSNNNDDEESSSTTAKQSGSGRASGSRTTTSKPKSTTFDARLPAGGISMITPSALAGSQFYKVGQWVTFAWNYTSLSITPSNIDIFATCTANQATYTIAVNHSAQETSVLWNTGETPQGQAPFLTETYTLLIHDTNTSITAAAKAGYLAAFSGLTFGMYTPQPYVPYDEFDCVNCNSALSNFEKMTIKAMMFTTGTTVASLLYFSYNFGLWL